MRLFFVIDALFGNLRSYRALRGGTWVLAQANYTGKMRWCRRGDLKLQGFREVAIEDYTGKT